MTTHHTRRRGRQGAGMGDARFFAEQKYPGDPYALLRWWCEASEGAAVQLAGLLAEVVELRAEVAKLSQQTTGEGRADG